MAWRNELVGLLVLAAGCGGRISEEEARRIFEANFLVATEVQGEASSAAEAADRDAGAKDVEVVVDDESGTVAVSGEVTGLGVYFEGTVLIDGTAVLTDDTIVLDLRTEYQEVYVPEVDVGLDGFVDMAAALAWDGTTEEYAGGDLHLVYALEGELEATGEAEGRAEFDYELVVDVSGTSIDVDASGEIDGHEVDGMTGSLSVDLADYGF